MKIYAVFQAMRYVLMVLFILSSSALGMQGGILPMVFSVSELVLLLAMLPFLRHEISGSGFNDMWGWIKKHFDFGMRAFMSNVLLGLNPRVDILILGYFASDYTVGVFSLAASAAEGLYQLPVVLRTNLNPILVRLLHEGKKEELHAISQRSMRLTYLAMLAVGVLVILLYPVGLGFVANKAKFMESWPFFAILVGGIILSSGYIPFSNILMLGGYPGSHTVMITLLVLFNILGNILLVPLLGGMGAAIATALSYVFLIPLVKLFANRILGVII
jgi:O-antigen/teichoic acid export membrane protein